MRDFAELDGISDEGRSIAGVNLRDEESSSIEEDGNYEYLTNDDKMVILHEVQVEEVEDEQSCTEE